MLIKNWQSPSSQELELWDSQITIDAVEQQKYTQKGASCFHAVFTVCRVASKHAFINSKKKYALLFLLGQS